jgi:hypothetical protein
MHYQQNRRILRPYRDATDGVPALLPQIVYAITADQASLVLKRQRRKLERDALMLALVQPVLPLAHS